jgi:hypothetical protein
MILRHSRQCYFGCETVCVFSHFLGLLLAQSLEGAGNLAYQPSVCKRFEQEKPPVVLGVVLFPIEKYFDSRNVLNSDFFAEDLLKRVLDALVAAGEGAPDFGVREVDYPGVDGGLVFFFHVISQFIKFPSDWTP